MPFLMGCGEHPGLNARPLQVSAASTRCTGSRNSRLVSSIITSDHVLGGHGAADEPPCFHEARPALTTLLVFLLLAPPQPQRCFGVTGGSAGDLKTNVQVQFRKEKDACGLLPRRKACKKVTWVKGAAPQGAGLHLGIPRAPCPHHEPACRTGDHSPPAYTPASAVASVAVPVIASHRRCARGHCCLLAHHHSAENTRRAARFAENPGELSRAVPTAN